MRRCARLLLAALICACGAAAPRSAQADMTLETYVAISSGQTEASPDVAYLYLVGVLDGLQTLNAVIGSLTTPFFCVQDEAGLVDADAVEQRFNEHLQALPSERDDASSYMAEAAVGPVLLQLLADEYPCATVVPR